LLAVTLARPYGDVKISFVMKYGAAAADLLSAEHRNPVAGNTVAMGSSQLQLAAQGRS
jgi:hypothetical protein